MSEAPELRRIWPFYAQSPIRLPSHAGGTAWISTTYKARGSERIMPSSSWHWHCFLKRGAFPARSKNGGNLGQPCKSKARSIGDARRGDRQMRFGKTISGKLYAGCGAILAIAITLFVADLAAVGHEQTTGETYRKAIDMANLRSSLDKSIRDNRLHLRNFLLNGDPREADLLFKGIGEAEQLISKIEEASSYLSQDRDK